MRRCEARLESEDHHEFHHVHGHQQHGQHAHNEHDVLNCYADRHRDDPHDLQCPTYQISFVIQFNTI